MNATIKATEHETVVRFDNGAVVHITRLGASAWAPGGINLHAGSHHSTRTAFRKASQWAAPTPTEE